VYLLDLSSGLAKFQSRALLAGAAGVFGSLDTSLNIAFPNLVDDFGLVVSDLQWVVVFYVLVYGGLLLAAGQLADSLGYGRVLQIGAGVSTAALVLCATAPTFEWLLAARVLQGIGVAMVMASAPALLTTGSAVAHTRAVGVFQTAAAAGLAIGPIVGGPLVEWYGWRSVFWFRVPLGLLLLLLTLRNRTTTVAKSSEVDRVGTLLVSISLGAAVLALNLTGTRGWGDPVVIIAAVSAVLSAAGFVGLSGRVAHPVLELELFRSVDFAAANVLAIIANGAMFATWLLVPSLLIDQLGTSLLIAGLVLAASPAATAAASSLAGRSSGRTASWSLGALGLVAEGAGMIGLSQVDVTWSGAHVALLLAVVGLGLGLFSVPNMATVMQGVGNDKQGVAGGLSLMTRTIGVVAGVAAASALADRIEPTRGFLGSFEVVFAVSGAVLWGSGLLAVVLAVRPLVVRRR
jgi:MFS family permease